MAFEGHEPTEVQEGYAGYNAQLTLLGTLAGFVISLPGIGLLKLINASAVLVLAALVFIVAAVGGLRLKVTPGPRGRLRATPEEGDEPVEVRANKPIEDREVILGLTASATVRLTAGFLTCLLYTSRCV